MADIFDMFGNDISSIVENRARSGSGLPAFFKGGGVFLFDEKDAASEATYYKLEILMGEPEGVNITEAAVDEDGELCVFYDADVMDEDTAISKYKNNQYKRSI